jgi:hypothetical protein
MAQIGFSTGAVSKFTEIPEDRINYLTGLEIDAIEIILAEPEFVLNFKLDEIKPLLKDIDNISIHSVFRTIKHNKMKQSLDKLGTICSKLDASGVVFHPGTEEEYALLENVGFPVLIENMDAAKPFGKSVAYFSELFRTFNFGFVLDIQHAYLNDPTMVLAQKLVNTFETRLKHIHISECDSKLRHIPLYNNANDPIATFLRNNSKSRQVAWLDEGAVTKEIDLQTELTYLHNLQK